MYEAMMMKGAAKLVGVCAAVQAGEEALIVTDAGRDPRIATVLAQALVAAGARPTVMVMTDIATDSAEPNQAVTAAMRSSAVVFTPLSASITHTSAGQQACAGGTRIVNMTQWTAGMMVSGGIDADFVALEPTVRALARVWDNANAVHVTTAGGTDLRLDISGRRGTPHAKTGIVRAGEFHPVPDVESPVSPVTAEGRIVCDASIPYLGIGVLSAPVILDVRDGKVIDITGGRDADTVRKAWAAMNDPAVYNIAELGVGLNPECRMTGLMLEDEGVANTCHIGIGTSVNLGGTVKASCHYDFLMWDPTIVVDGRVVMDEGRLLVSAGE
ncbi:MAG: aminopeptidase [Jatrophihabitans sp.]